MKDSVLDVGCVAEPCVVEPVTLAASTLVMVGVLSDGVDETPALTNSRITRPHTDWKAMKAMKARVAVGLA